MKSQSVAFRLRRQLFEVVDRLSDLIKALQIRRLERVSEHFVVVAPEFYFAERTAEQQAIQLDLKRKYETVSELLKVLLQNAPTALATQFKDGDEHVRSWLDLNAGWSVSPNAVENAKRARDSAEPLQRILDVLDVASKAETILVPDTNSMIGEGDPVKYRTVVGQNAFVFMLLPTVLGELDRLKVEHRNPDVREKAKQVITRIKGWRNQGSLPNGVIVDKTIQVKSSHSEPDMKNTLSWLDPNNNDDRIIASVLALQGAHPAANVILVSGDINMQNKADAALIETIEGP